MPAHDQASIIILADPDLFWQPFVLIFSGLAVLLVGALRCRPLPALAGLVACECGAWLDDDLTLAVGAAVAMLAIWLIEARDTRQQPGEMVWQAGEKSG